jgi:hypothetical protein
MLKILRIPNAMKSVMSSLVDQRLHEEREEQQLQNPVQVARVNSSQQEQTVEGWLANQNNDFTSAPVPYTDCWRRDDDGVNTNFKEN